MNQFIKKGFKMTFPLLVGSLICFCYVCICGILDTTISPYRSFNNWFHLAIYFVAVFLFFSLVIFIITVIGEYKDSKKMEVKL